MTVGISHSAMLNSAGLTPDKAGTQAKVTYVEAPMPIAIGSVQSFIKRITACT